MKLSKHLLFSIIIAISFLGKVNFALADCEDACDSGHNACVDECPSSVHDNDSGGDFQNTDAQSQCEDACDAGKNSCESEC